MADNDGQDEERRYRRTTAPMRPVSPSLDMPIASTSAGWRISRVRSRSESPMRAGNTAPAAARSRSAPRRPPPPPVHPRSVRFLLPDDLNPEAHTSFLKRKMHIPNESKTEDDSPAPASVPEELIENEAPGTSDGHHSTKDRLHRTHSTRFYLNIDKEPAETSTDDKQPEQPDNQPPEEGLAKRSHSLKNLVTHRKEKTVQSRRSIEKTPTKVTRIMYTTDEEVRDALFEFAVFIVFLILTSLVTLSVRHSYMFYFNDTMKRLFTQREMAVAPAVTITFEKIVTVPDWWDYLSFNFFVTLHGEITIINTDGSAEPDQTEDPVLTTTAPNEAKQRRAKREDMKPKEQKKPLEGRIFLHQNLMLGPPRLRQIRVAKDSCFVNDAFIRYFNTCYAEYSPEVEDIKADHGGAPYKTMSELDATPIWTTLNFYRSGGYTIDMSYDKTENINTIQRLRTSNWLDRSSRLCLIEFNLYNENTDVFQSAKLIAEIPPTGGVIPQSHLQTVKQFSFITEKSLTMLVIYIVWYIMVIYYNISDITEIQKSGIRNYFKVLLNILDSIIVMFAYLALVYNIWHTYKVQVLVSSVKRYDTYQSLDTLCFWNVIYVDMMAILAFLVWIKIFKFISFNKTLVQFTTTLKRCSKDLAGFSLMFGIVFLAYAQLGLLLFGTQHPDFRNFITSILTMIRMILGDFQYNLIEQANRVLGPIYFLTYILLVFFILLNMFLAIIMETYNSVKSEITQGRSQLGNYIYKKLSYWFYYITHCGRKRDFSKRTEHREFADDPIASSRSLPTNFHKHITPKEAQYFDDVPNEVRSKDIYRLNNRVSLLEDVLEQLVTNMDTILNRVEEDLKKVNKNYKAGDSKINMYET